MLPDYSVLQKRRSPQARRFIVLGVIVALVALVPVGYAASQKGIEWWEERQAAYARMLEHRPESSDYRHEKFNYIDSGSDSHYQLTGRCLIDGNWKTYSIREAGDDSIVVTMN